MGLCCLVILFDDEALPMLINEGQSGSWELLVSPYTVEQNQEQQILLSSLSKLTSIFDSLSGTKTIIG